MKIEDNFDFIDDFLAHCEDFLHGQEGEDCSESRKKLKQIKDTFL